MHRTFLVLVRQHSESPEKVFVDYTEVQFQGGRGGNGCALFKRKWANEFAGPSGGDGGNGGHLIIEASKSVRSLSDIRREYIGLPGSNGKHGPGGAQNGADASHTVLSVPVGTIVRENDTQLIDLNYPGSRYIACRGGIGGQGNRSLVSSTHTVPEESSPGSVGECRRLALELSIMAQVGLVGFPNAGKSSLLRAISNATPEVAAYPFTTLNPHIGMVEYDDAVQISVADIPGIIRGAHQNEGLGLSFLKHIKRCETLLYVIDISVESYRQQLEYLKYELEKYQSGLSKVPSLIVANKIDLEGSSSRLESLCEESDSPVIGVSALKRTNVYDMCQRIRKLLKL